MTSSADEADQFGFDKLKLGQHISEAECIVMVGCSRHDNPDAYALKLLALKARIEQHLASRFRRSITVRAQQHSLQILTDEESAAYNPKRFADGLRIARRAHRRLLGVDVSKLTPQQRDEFGHSVTRQAARLAMMKMPTPDAPLQPVVNNRPKLFPMAPKPTK